MLYWGALLRYTWGKQWEKQDWPEKLTCSVAAAEASRFLPRALELGRTFKYKVWARLALKQVTFNLRVRMWPQEPARILLRKSLSPLMRTIKMSIILNILSSGHCHCGENRLPGKGATQRKQTSRTERSRDETLGWGPGSDYAGSQDHY